MHMGTMLLMCLLVEANARSVDALAIGPTRLRRAASTLAGSMGVLQLVLCGGLTLRASIFSPQGFS